MRFLQRNFSIPFILFIDIFIYYIYIFFLTLYLKKKEIERILFALIDVFLQYSMQHISMLKSIQSQVSTFNHLQQFSPRNIVIKR